MIFFKQLLVQNELIFNLWIKWITPEFDYTFFLGEGEIQGGEGVKNLGKSDYVISERSLNM